jgi:hypothetical protein
MLTNQIHDAPTTVALLDVSERECGNLGSSQPAAEKNGDDGSVSQALHGRGVGRTEQSLCLPQRQPVSGPDALRFRALHPCDSSRQLRREQPVSAASAASLRIADMRMIIDEDPSAQASSDTRQALTVALAKRFGPISEWPTIRTEPILTFPEADF